MFRITAVSLDDKGYINAIIIDSKTVLGRDKGDAKIKYAIENADKLKGKEVSLIVEGPFTS